jgi:hypothetical protein
MMRNGTEGCELPGMTHCLASLNACARRSNVMPNLPADACVSGVYTGCTRGLPVGGGLHGVYTWCTRVQGGQQAAQTKGNPAIEPKTNDERMSQLQKRFDERTPTKGDVASKHNNVRLASEPHLGASEPSK